MARLGAFDITLSVQGWFDNSEANPRNGWMDNDFVGAGSTPPPAPGTGNIKWLSWRPRQMIHRIR